MGLKAAKRQTLIMAATVAAEHAAKRGELAAKLTKPQANRIMQAIGVSHGFARVPYAFAVGELRAVWAKEYAASPRRKQPVTAQVNAKSVTAKAKARTKKATKAAKASTKPEAQASTKPEAQASIDERLAALEDNMATIAAALAKLAATK